MDDLSPDVLAEIADFLRAWPHVTIATAAPGRTGSIEAATIGLAVASPGELVFDTLTTTRKFENLRAAPQVAFVIGWDDHRTLQLEGTAEPLEPGSPDYQRLLPIYLDRFPDGRDRLSWPGIVHVRVRVAWLRYSDYRGATPRIFELVGAAIDAMR